MKERIHEQITHELKQATRADLFTVILSIVVTFLLFAIAIVFAYRSTEINFLGLMGKTSNVLSTHSVIIMFVIIAAIVVINWFAAYALLKNRERRAKLNRGLMKLYKDEGMSQYYDGSIFKAYETRYSIFAAIVSTIGATAVIVPLVIFINQVIQI